MRIIDNIAIFPAEKGDLKNKLIILTLLKVTEQKSPLQKSETWSRTILWTLFNHSTTCTVSSSAHISPFSCLRTLEERISKAAQVSHWVWLPVSLPVTCSLWICWKPGMGLVVRYHTAWRTSVAWTRLWSEEEIHPQTKQRCSNTVHCIISVEIF